MSTGTARAASTVAGKAAAADLAFASQLPRFPAGTCFDSWNERAAQPALREAGEQGGSGAPRQACDGANEQNEFLQVFVLQ